LAWYAFAVCIIVLFTNGWNVFVHNSWCIAETETSCTPSGPSDERITTPVSTFLSSYIPLPLFVLLTFGYKLIYQTKLVPLDEMTFSREDVPEKLEEDDPPRNIWEKIITKFI